MKMPKNLVLVRHGESELNIISRLLKKNNEEYPPEMSATPDREFRLSPKGVEQSKDTGLFLKEKYGEFDVIYCSDFVRAKETAALVCLSAGWENANIKIDPQLGERNWGIFNLKNSKRRKQILALKGRDPLHSPMPHGETLLETRNRTRVLLERCSRQFGDKKVLVFTHGEYIESIWSEICHFRTETQRDFFSSPQGDIKNCQVVDFMSSDSGKFEFVSSSNPFNGEVGVYLPIQRQVLTPKEIMEEVMTYKHFNVDKK